MIHQSSTIVKTTHDILDELKNIKEKYGYHDIPENLKIGLASDGKYFRSKFSCHDQAQVMNEVGLERGAIVTGFGPTNTPTAGTLSVMLKAIGLQRESGLHTTIIISDLGAWNSRNLDWALIERHTEKFINFIGKIGFNFNQGILRSHKDKDNLVISGLITKVLKEDDFKSNKEATDQLYDLMNLRGSFLSIMLDGIYTIADIVNPLFHGKERVLVLAGIEEHYFSKLAQIVVQRLNEVYRGEFISVNSKTSALFASLIEGLHPYPKMSKSIPDSAINIGDSERDVRRKIMECPPENERVIMQMIDLVSDWPATKIAVARKCFMDANEDPISWRMIKEEYLEYFITLMHIWASIKA